MALVSRLSSRTVLISRNFPQIQRYAHSFRNAKRSPRTYVQTMCIIGGGVTAFIAANLLKSKSVQALNMKKMRDGSDDDKYVQLTSRERRFIKFSSVEYNGQLFMTPLDFLDSVVEQEPRPRLKRRSLTHTDIENCKEVTPPLSKGTPKMFRSLRDRGIISYTEYLFLLSILTKPQSGFRIAFNMFDTDGNQRVDKNEFLVIQTILGGTLLDNDYDDETLKFITRLVPEHQAKLLFAKRKERQQTTKPKPLMEKIFSGVWKTKRGVQDKGDSNDREIYVNDEEGLQRKHRVDTTLQIHLFGKTGTQDLKYEGFYKFMDNLQTEVLQLEFSEFSKGNIAITEVDFAKILLRYTYLDTNEYDSFLERLLGRVKKEKGILFEEFRDFCRFLNNLDDFTIAMRMYTLADRAISKEEFSRAVKVSTGLTLAPHVVDTVFAIFDVDGDGLLSFKEFIAIMKDRLHRGFKSVPKSEGWDAFKTCIKQEMRQNKRQNSRL